MDSASDIIYWAPLVVRDKGIRMGEEGALPVHFCEHAVVIAPARRDALDWMALGTCRYCNEPLPAA